MSCQLQTNKQERAKTLEIEKCLKDWKKSQMNEFFKYFESQKHPKGFGKQSENFGKSWKVEKSIS